MVLRRTSISSKPVVVDVPVWMAVTLLRTGAVLRVLRVILVGVGVRLPMGRAKRLDVVGSVNPLLVIRGGGLVGEGAGVAVVLPIIVVEVVRNAAGAAS